MIRTRAGLLLILLLSAAVIAACRAGSSDVPAIRKDPGTPLRAVNLLIAYQSTYGSTRQYAEWIRQAADGDLADIGTGDTIDVAAYDILIIGGYVRMGKISVAPFIEERWNVLNGKEVILFTTSGTPPRHPRIQSIYEKSLPEEIRSKIRYFPLAGRISRKDLTLWDTFLIALGKVVEQDEALKKGMGKDYDGVQRENLLPLLAHLERVRAALTGKK
ncbi:MAG: flavodoxin domain-containing protein [Syntrophales bacterium]